MSTSKSFSDEVGLKLTKYIKSFRICFSCQEFLIHDIYCRCLEILYQIAFSSVANYSRSYRKRQFGIKSKASAYMSRHLHIESKTIYIMNYKFLTTETNSKAFYIFRWF